jgi:hypothetical protein
VAARKWDEAKTMLEGLVGEIKPVYEEYLRQKAAKETYEPEREGFDGEFAGVEDYDEPTDQIDSLTPEGVYRMQPSFEKSEMVVVPPDEIKTGMTYNYYNQTLGRRVWGFAQEDGSFQYAFGEGAVLPATLFDLRITPELRSMLLERGAPGLEQALAATGGTPSVRLDADGQWSLLPVHSSARIFDMETGHRWEWHGKRRVAVLHTYGDQWRMVDGRYRPATGPVVFFPVGCGTVRAGSASLVVRTSE